MSMLPGLVCIIERLNHYCIGKMHAMVHVGLLVLLYELTGRDEEYCIVLVHCYRL